MYCTRHRPAVRAGATHRSSIPRFGVKRGLTGRSGLGDLRLRARQDWTKTPRTIVDRLVDALPAKRYGQYYLHDVNRSYTPATCTRVSRSRCGWRMNKCLVPSETGAWNREVRRLRALAALSSVDDTGGWPNTALRSTVSSCQRKPNCRSSRGAKARVASVARYAGRFWTGDQQALVVNAGRAERSGLNPVPPSEPVTGRCFTAWTPATRRRLDW
jgi:hypothetical protein